MARLVRDMEALKDYALSPGRVRDKVLKAEIDALRRRYDDQLTDLREAEEEERRKKLEEMEERMRKLKDEVEQKKRDFDMLGMFEKRLEEK